MAGAQTATCPKCGKPMPAGGVCPKCVLEFAFEDDESTLSKRFPSLQQDPPLTGQFGPYRILGVLGRGGMGVVYSAQQIALQRKVALKVLPKNLAKDIEFTERFQREAKAMASLTHRHLVAVYEFGCLDGRFYYAMEHVEGSSLRALLMNGKLTTEHALRLIPQICDALSYAHQHKIVHRDIKPENVLVDLEGNAKIADFGLAKNVDPAHRTMSLTGTMEVLGTLAYAAPEQLENARGVDHRADLYSLGVMMYEMLTGGLPKEGCGPPSRYATIDPRLDPIVMKAMEKLPEKRWQDAGQIKDETTRCTAVVAVGEIATPRPAPPSGGPPPARPAAARKKPSSSSVRAVPPSPTAATVLRQAPPPARREFPVGVAALLGGLALGVGLLFAAMSKEAKRTPQVAATPEPPAIVERTEPPIEGGGLVPPVVDPIQQPLTSDPAPPDPEVAHVDPGTSTPDPEPVAPDPQPAPSDPGPEVVAQPDPEPQTPPDPEPDPVTPPDAEPATPHDPVPVTFVEELPAQTKDPLAKMGSELRNSGELSGWSWLSVEEKRDKSPFGKPELKDGVLTFRPHAAVWYEQRRGPFLYREVKGDFALTVRLNVTGKEGQGAPQGKYCVAGLLLRWPTSVAPGKWKFDLEHWLFHAIGTRETPGRYEFESKSTRGRKTILDDNVELADGGEALMQVVRVGSNTYFLVKQPRGEWRVAKRGYDNTMPPSLQVGLATCTDPETAWSIPPEQHNAKAIPGGNPDLRVQIDYLRFRTPKAPSDCQEVRKPWDLGAARLLSFMGEHLDGRK